MTNKRERAFHVSSMLEEYTRDIKDNNPAQGSSAQAASAKKASRVTGPCGEDESRVNTACENLSGHVTDKPSPTANRLPSSSRQNNSTDFLIPFGSANRNPGLEAEASSRTAPVRESSVSDGPSESAQATPSVGESLHPDEPSRTPDKDSVLATIHEDGAEHKSSGETVNDDEWVPESGVPVWMQRLAQHREAKKLEAKEGDSGAGQPGQSGQPGRSEQRIQDNHEQEHTGRDGGLLGDRNTDCSDHGFDPGSTVQQEPVTLAHQPALDPAVELVRNQAYLEGALRIQSQEVAETKVGRNNRLYEAGLKIGNYIHYGIITEQDVLRELTEAFRACGGVKKYGLRGTKSTIMSGLKTGMSKPRSIPAPDVTSSYVADPDLEDLNNPDSWDTQYQFLNKSASNLQVTRTNGTAVTGSTAPVSPIGTVSASGAGGAGNNTLEFPHDFFDQSNVLKHIQTYAHSAINSAPSLLVAVLARVLLEAGPHVLIPKIVGSDAALNLGFNLTGTSGAGKSSAMKESQKLLGVDQRALVKPLGSGEGMIDSFLIPGQRGAPSTLVDDPRRLFNVDEIEKLKNLMERTGSSVGADLRSALMGDHMGTANAHAGGRNRELQELSYRMILIAAVQPELAGFLLDGSDSGLPQRFLWVSFMDRLVPELDNLPADPGALNWSNPWPDYAGSPVYLDVDPSIKTQIMADKRAVSVGQVGADPRKSHLNLTRLKVSAALAALHSELGVTEYWWNMAGVLTDHSLAVQEYCQHSIAGVKRKKRAAWAKEQGDAQVVISDVQHERGVARVSSKILAKLEFNQLVSAGDLNRSMSSRDKPYLSDAIDELLRTGRILRDDTSPETGGRPSIKYTLAKPN